MSMKPSERIEEIYRTRKDMTLAGSIIQYLDEQAELLETHTIKEEDEMVRCEHGLIAGDECDCGKDYHNEEPATPKKKCCDDCKKYELGVNCQCVCHGVLPRHQGEKLTTSSYEVTRGRCEKSIKHSCGRV